MRKYIIAACVLILTFSVFGFAANKSFKDAGILSMRTVEEAENIPFRFYAVFNEGGQSEI